MAEISEANRNHVIALDTKDDHLNHSPGSLASQKCDDSSICLETVHFIQQLMAELIGTYLLMLVAFGAIIVNIDMEKIITFPGVAILWGLDVMVMFYTVSHISGAHFNPAVTIAFATCKKFAWKRVPAYVCAQLLASTLATATLRLIFNGKKFQFLRTLPAGSNMQSLIVEFIITFYLMFAVCGVAVDDRAVKEFAGLAVGATVTVNSLFAGPISGASMNPARSLGPAIVSYCYTGIWIYIVGPIAGAIAGCWVYNFIRIGHKPFSETIKRASFFRGSSKSASSDKKSSFVTVGNKMESVVSLVFCTIVKLLKC